MVCLQRIVNDYFKISSYKIINDIINCEKNVINCNNIYVFKTEHIDNASGGNNINISYFS